MKAVPLSQLNDHLKQVPVETSENEPNDLILKLDLTIVSIQSQLYLISDPRLEIIPVIPRRKMDLQVVNSVIKTTKVILSPMCLFAVWRYYLQTQSNLDSSKMKLSVCIVQLFRWK
jgi:hypothetical protein